MSRGPCRRRLAPCVSRDGTPGVRARPSRGPVRDRRGRGLRGALAPGAVPRQRTRGQQFDDLVLDAVEELEGRWAAELAARRVRRRGRPRAHAGRQPRVRPRGDRRPRRAARAGCCATACPAPRPRRSSSTAARSRPGHATAKTAPTSSSWSSPNSSPNSSAATSTRSTRDGERSGDASQARCWPCCRLYGCEPSGSCRRCRRGRRRRRGSRGARCSRPTTRGARTSASPAEPALGGLGAQRRPLGAPAPGLRLEPTYGIPLRRSCPPTSRRCTIQFTAYGAQSDPGPYPIPRSAHIEAGSDRHVLVASHNCHLYELYDAHRTRTRLGRGVRRGVQPALEQAAPGRLDLGRRRGAADPAPGSSVRPRSRPGTSTTRCASPSSTPSAATSIRRPTRPARPTRSNVPPMGARFRLKASFSLRGYHGAAPDRS